MGINTYSLNRPINLARRDLYVERARELFHLCLKDPPGKKRIQRIHTTLYYLQSAMEHARLAVKASATGLREESFILFLQLVSCYLHSTRVLIENEAELANPKSHLWQFLHREGKAETTPGFARSSEQLLQDVEHLFAIADEPFRNLRDTLLAQMNVAERERYQRAYDSLRKHLDARGHHQHAVIGGRIVYPILEMMYE